MEARDYQADCIARAIRAFHKYRKVLGVLATGGGKTIVFSLLAQKAKGRTLIIAHRDELINQAAEKLHRATGITAGVHQGKRRAKPTDRVVVASIQTLTRNYAEFPPEEWGIIIVDEAHHTMAATYIKVLEYFVTGGAYVLGVTATPNVKGKGNLAKFYEATAFEHGLIDLMRRGWLVPMKVKGFPLHCELPEMVRGKWKDEEVDVALTPQLEDMCRRLRGEVEDKKTLIFVPLVKTVHSMVRLLRQNGITADGVWGDDPDREAKLGYHGSRHQVLVNSSMLTEGYDDPEIEVVSILRPMHSENAVSQMVGRGTRLYCPWGCTQYCTHESRKKHLLWLDPLWLHETKSLVRPANLVADNEELAETMEQRLQAAHEEIDLLDLMDASQEQIDHEREKSLAQALAKKQARLSRAVDFQQWALTCRIPEVAMYQHKAAWEAEPITDKQREHLERAGIAPAGLTKGKANAVLHAFWERQKNKLAPAWMVQRIRSHSSHPAPERLTRIEAEGIIAKIDQLELAPRQ